MIKAALLDIDGTFLDSNGAHAQAWVDALAQHGHTVTVDQVLPLIGKGGDKLLAELLSIDADSDDGRAISDERKRLFTRDHLPHLKPTRGARALLERLQGAGLRLVVATSATGEELEGLLRQAGIADLIDSAASSSDAAQSKPDPDIVQAALRRADADATEAVLIGDTPHDVQAGAAAGVVTVALRCGGGWSDLQLGGVQRENRQRGPIGDAVRLFDDPADLLARLDDSPFGASQKESSSASAPTQDPVQGAIGVDPLDKDSSGAGGSNYGGLRDAASARPASGTYDPAPPDDASPPASHFAQRQAQKALPDPAGPVSAGDVDESKAGQAR